MKNKNEKARVEIIVGGVVQGVGFRYFTVRTAKALGIKGYAKNLFTGEVLIEAEGERYLLKNLIEQVKKGPSRAYVKDVKISWGKYKNEFTDFEVRY